MSYNIHYALAHYMMIIYYNIKLDIEVELIFFLKKYTILKSTKTHRKKRVRKHNPIHVYLVAKVFNDLLHF